MLVAFGDTDSSTESKEAFDRLHKTLSGGQRRDATIGGLGFSKATTVNWHPDVGLWSFLDRNETKNQFWCCYGIEDPTKGRSLNIAVEVNPPRQGTSLNYGGAFARDDQGRTHLCHTGKIGGGRQGIGKKTFLKHYRGDLCEMSYAGGVAGVVDLGPVDSKHLPQRLSRFAREVLRVKDAARATESPCISSEAGQQENDKDMPAFRPEFSGRRRVYARGGTTEALADHGLVVDALVRAVEKLELTPHNNQQRDLFVTDHSQGREILFEVKTDISTTSIYTAVGQLLLNGRAIRGDTRLVLVVPDTPTDRFRDALHTIGVDVLEYTWCGRIPEVKLEEIRRLIG